MKKSNKIICFIPARSGSTRIKNKNIKLIRQRPLVYWTVLKALKSKQFDKIIFSSDSIKYYNNLIKYLKKDKLNYQNLIFDKRDIVHSKTKSKIFDYIKNDLIKKFNFDKNDLLVQLLPTCPLRSVETIVKAIKLSLIDKKNYFSVSEYDFHLSFAININNKKWKPKFKKSPLITGNTQSQDQKKYYHPNGVINCMFIKNLSHKTKSIYINGYPLIVSQIEALDIDTEEDFKLLKLISIDNKVFK